MSLTQPSVAAVRAIITTTLTDEQVQSFIDDAALMAEGCECLSGLASERQAAIVKYMTAHLISMQSGKGGIVTAEKMGSASKSYATGTAGADMMLSSSRYGQQAILLDTTGCLAQLGKVRAFGMNI